MSTLNSKIDIGSLSVESGGSGPPALLIHGFGANKFTWRHLCIGISRSYTYHAIDLPGSGDSPMAGDFSPTLENFADVIIGYVLRNDLRKLTLIAHSLGAAIALIALIRGDSSFSSRVLSLCIIDGVSYWQELPPFVAIWRVPIIGSILTDLLPARTQVRVVLKYCYFNDHFVADDQVEKYAEYFARPNIRQALKKTARLLDRAQLSLYARSLMSLQVPTLLIWGRNDRVVPLRYGVRLSKDLPNAQIVTIDECGHMPQEERPTDVIDAINSFQMKIASLGRAAC